MSASRVRIALLALVTAASARAHDHSQWDELLARHVREGRVDYRGLAGDRERLDGYLDGLAAADGVETWPREEQLAFWLNAYNARMTAIVLDHYPIRGEDPGHPRSSILQVPGAFRTSRAPLAGRSLSQDEIEHEILRARFDEPRIHAALVCAAVSCPPLRAEAYAAERLDAQLEDQATRFLNDPGKNSYDLESGVARLSRIFEWFAEDFADSTGATPALRRSAGELAGVLAFVSRRVPEPVAEAIRRGELDVEFLPYDWTLNDVPSPATTGP